MKKNYDQSWSRLQTALNPSLSRSQSNKSTRRSFVQTCSASSRRISIVSQTEHPLIPSWQIKQLFKNKCLDMDIPEVPDQENRFLALSLSNFKNRSFTLSESGLGKRSAVVIGRILKCNHFAYVNLSRNSLRDSGSVALFEELRNNSTIVHVDLSNNEISPEGFVKIFTMMRVHPSIISLDLSSYDGLHRNRLGEEGVQVLQRLLLESPLLQFLSLSGTSLGEHLDLISDGLHNNTSLISLDLSNNQIDWTAVPALSSSLVTTCLQKLNLSSNRISDKGCKSLSALLGNRQGCCPLNYLNISNNLIRKKGASHIFNALRFNNIMEELVIHSNDLSFNFQSYFPAFLAENCGLVKLDVSNCALNAKSWPGIDFGIAKNRRIEVLSLANNLITDDGLAGIANGMAKNKKMRHLDLSSCHLKDSCGEVLGKALRGNSSLEAIVLKSNNLKEKALEALLDLTRMNRNVVVVNVDSNPANLKVVAALKAQLRENKKLQQRQVIPKILNEIENIKEPISKFVETHHEVRKNLEKRIKSEKRLWRAEENFDEIKEQEEKLTREFKEMLEKLKNENLKKSIVIEELKNEEIETKVSLEKAISNLQTQIRKSEIDHSKCQVLKSSKTEEYLSQKAKLMERLQNFQYSLKQASFEKSCAESKLDSLRQSLFEKRSELKSLTPLVEPVLKSNSKLQASGPPLSKIPSQFLASYKLAKNKDKYSPKKKKSLGHNPKSKSFSLLNN